MLFLSRLSKDQSAALKHQSKGCCKSCTLTVQHGAVIRSSAGTSKASCSGWSTKQQMQLWWRCSALLRKLHSPFEALHWLAMTPAQPCYVLPRHLT